MRPPKLNLAALRARGNSCTNVHSSGGPNGQRPADFFLVSRRQFIGMAGAATVGGTSLVTALAESDSDRVEILEGQNRIAFALRGHELWAIDTRRFGGRPRLEVKRGEKDIRVELTGAKYPGTDLTADLVCVLRGGDPGWRMDLSLALGRFTAEDVPFERWLTGQARAQSLIDLGQSYCDFHDIGTITISGPMKSSFGPDWTLRAAGESTLAVGALGGEFAGDGFTVALLKPGDSSLSAEQVARRSLVTVSRGAGYWPMRPQAGGPDGWRVEVDDNIFDVIHIESGESRRGTVRHTLLAESLTEPATVYFGPAEEIKGSDGEPFRLPLKNPRFALSSGTSGGHRALVAEVDPTPAWLHAGPCSLLVGGEDGTHFQLVRDEASGASIECPLVLHSVTALLEGGVARPLTLPANARLLLRYGSGERNAGPEAAATLNIDKKKDQVWVEIPITSVDVVRPEDLVALRFEFTNLLLRSVVAKGRILFIFPTEKHKGLELVRLDPKRPVFITVHFPQQNIAEQAFFEADPNFPGQSEPLLAPPVRSRISGGSRLAFRLPDNIGRLPYTLDALLDWSQFEQSVVATALPAGETTTEGISEPDRVQTAIEFPYRLFLSPNRFAAWAHENRPKTRPASAPADPAQQPGQEPGGLGVTSVEWTELWHTRLAVRTEGGVADEGSKLYRTLRAVWTPDQRGGNSLPSFCTPKQKSVDPNDPNFRKSMDGNDRYEIVRLSSDFNIRPAPSDAVRQYTPSPISVELFMLTSLGAWTDIEGAWGDRPESSGLSLRDWRHRATMGRDNYVRVVYGGYLYPYGHRANLTQVTERKFKRPEGGGPITAYLQQRVFITVEEPIKAYGNTNLVTGGGKSVDRMLPYHSVEITTLVTPNLDDPEAGPCSIAGKCAFWPCVGGQKFLFHMVGEDHGGQRSEMNAPAIFVVYAAAHSTDPVVRRAVAQSFRSQQAGRIGMNGQNIAFVPPTQPGDTTYETHTLNFNGLLPEEVSPVSPTPVPEFVAAPAVETARAEGPSTHATAVTALVRPDDQPESCKEPLPAPWHPIIDIAEVKIPALAQLLGLDITVPPIPIEWHDTYLIKGFDPKVPLPNVGEVFARLRDEIPLSLPPSRSVGLVKPDFDVSGLSRRFGTVSGKIREEGGVIVDNLKVLAEGNFDPANYFGEALSQAKLMGFISLRSIIEQVLFSFDTDGIKIPNVKTRTLYDQNQLPESIESRMQWQPDIKNLPGDIVSFEKLDQAAMTLEVILQTRLRSGGSTYDLLGELRDFRIKIVNAVAVDFDRLSFNARSGQKPQVDVDIKTGGVQFLGALEFVSELQKNLSKSLFGDNGPTIEITPTSVVAGVGFTLPDLAFGAFSLQNIRLSAKLFLPLTGDKPVRLRFAFGERSDPFLVAVTILGGGGFLAISLGVDGIESVEAAIEFGGILAISIVAASGKVYALAGIYFSYERGPGITLTGYLRCGGALTVLGLITVSVEFYMGLTYRPSTGCVEGEASVTVRISILFFSKSVRLTLKRQFAGSRGGCGRTLVASLSGAEMLLGNAPRQASFEQFMPRPDWNTYCDAFAADV